MDITHVEFTAKMKGFEEILSQLIAEGKSLETEIQKNAKRKEEDQQKTISLNVKSMTEVLPIHRTTIGLFLIDYYHSYDDVHLCYRTVLPVLSR